MVVISADERYVGELEARRACLVLVSGPSLPFLLLSLFRFLALGHSGSWVYSYVQVWIGTRRAGRVGGVLVGSWVQGHVARARAVTASRPCAYCFQGLDD